MKGMSFTNLIYLILWLFIYYFVLLFIPYGTNLLSNLPTFGTYWSTIPPETVWLLNILLYIVVPIVAIAFTIKASSPEQQIVVAGG